MPHIVIEYTPSVRAVADIDEFVSVMHGAALDSKFFPIGGARTWAIATEGRALVGDGAAGNGFIFISVRILPGRTPEVREAIARLLFDTASTYLDACFSRIALGLQLEVSEFAAGSTLQRNNMLPGQSREMLAITAPAAASS